jgi:hypothetical protein
MARIIAGKLIYIHIAKCGGTYLKEILSRNGVPNWETGEEITHDHISYDDLMAIGGDYTGMEPFCTIRDPFKWIVSRHSWAMRTEFGYKIKSQPSAKNHWMASVWDDDVSVFVKNVCEKCPAIPTEYFSRMANILDPNSPVKVFRIEDTEQIISFIEQKCSVKIGTLDCLNAKRTKVGYENESAKAIIVANNSKLYEKFYPNEY